jgi:hypothetical protein
MNGGFKKRVDSFVAPRGLSDSDTAKALRERTVFDLFLSLTKYPIDPESITQDAPDIRCTILTGEPATFELVTIDSEESSQEWGNFYSTPNAWHRAMCALTEERRNIYLERYKHALITARYSKRIGQRDMIKIAASMIEHLLDQPQGFVGRLECGEHVVVAEALPNGSPRGPMMTDSMTPGFRPVVWDRIRDKVEKRYRVNGVFELIAYSYRDTLFHQAPDDAQPPVEQIREWLGDSPFRRVWIVEFHYKRIYRRIDRPDRAPGTAGLM